MGQKSMNKDVGDWEELVSSNNMHVGLCFRNEYLQQIPFFFNREFMNLNLIGMYKGYGCFLCCGGLSLKDLKLRRLNDPGVLSMSVNNAVSVVRTNMWICVDEPTHFVSTCWLDPKIMKFVPCSLFGEPLWDSRDGKWQPLISSKGQMVVGDCPNIIGYRRNEKFNEKRYLYEDTINWGDCEKHGGNRSVMLAAIRILFLLGIRRIYLLGVDFEMTETKKYAFDENRSNGSISGNNSTYEKLKIRFEKLKKQFDEAGLEIYNCNQDSQLKVFPYKSFEDALTFEKDLVGNPKNERTVGLYQTNYFDKQKEMIEMCKQVPTVYNDEAAKAEILKGIENNMRQKAEHSIKALEKIIHNKK